MATKPVLEMLRPRRFRVTFDITLVESVQHHIATIHGILSHLIEKGNKVSGFSVIDVAELKESTNSQPRSEGNG